MVFPICFRIKNLIGTFGNFLSGDLFHQACTGKLEKIRPGRQLKYEITLGLNCDRQGQTLEKHAKATRPKLERLDGPTHPLISRDINPWKSWELCVCVYFHGCLDLHENSMHLHRRAANSAAEVSALS